MSLCVCVFAYQKRGADSNSANSKAAAYASISNEVLRRAAEYQHQKAQSSKNACPVPEPEHISHEDSTAADFLRTVEFCSGSAQHTTAHSKQSSVKNFGLSNAYGKATYW
jgi:hypothetical protein